RSGERERIGRGDRDRSPARDVGSAPRRHPAPRAPPPRGPVRNRDDVRRGGAGAGRPVRARMSASTRRVAILLDIDGTLIVSGGAGARSWALAFDELYGIAADIGEFTDTGMTDPEVGRKTFEAVLGREPPDDEFARLLERREHYLHRTVAESDDYRVLPG